MDHRLSPTPSASQSRSPLPPRSHSKEPELDERAVKRIRVEDWKAHKSRTTQDRAAPSGTDSRQPPSGFTTSQFPPDIVRATPCASEMTLLRTDPGMLWARGLAHAVVDDRYYIIALNTNWIPRPVMGTVSIILRDDGRFGVEDPLNWPQLYSYDFPYLALIPKRPKTRSWFDVLWQRPAESDFLRANDCADGEAYGYLDVAWISSARGLVRTMCERAGLFKKVSRAMTPAVLEDLGRLIAALQASLTIFSVPSTYRNTLRQWARLHRCWTECWAFFLWHDEVKRQAETTAIGDPTRIAVQNGLDGNGVMGVVCSDQSIAQKWLAAGIPVWYLQLRHTTGSPQIEHRTPVELTEPRDVETSRTVMLGDVRVRVMAGNVHLRAISLESEAVLDIEHNPLPADFALDEELSLPVQGRSKKRAQRPRGTDRFQAKDHYLLPPRLPLWQDALSRVDTTQPCEARVGFWLPEPELVVTPQNPMRLLVHLSSWISVRLGLFSKLGRRDIYHPVGPDCWRTFLGRFPEQSEEEVAQSEQRRLATRAGGGSTRSNQNPKGNARNAEAHELALKKRHDRKEETCAFFTELLGRKHMPFQLRTPPISSFRWRGQTHVLDVAGAKSGQLPVPPDVVREIAWELSEVAFRVELCELDRILVPKTGHAAWSERHELLPIVFPGMHWSRPELPLRPPKGAPPGLHDRAVRLEGLRRLLSRWLECPPSLVQWQLGADSSTGDLDAFERDAARFYCTVAYQKWGRAAAVPRQPPESLRSESV